MDLQQPLDWACCSLSRAMNKQKVSKIFFLSLFLVVAPGCDHFLSNDYLSSFIIPSKDSDLIYHFSDGRLMQTRLVSVENNKMILEDLMETPKGLQLPDGMTWADLGAKNGYIKNRYSFIIKENQVIRQDRRGKQTLLMGPLFPSAKKWKTRMVKFQNTSIVEQFADCQIVERQKRLVLKQQRMTLTVDCLKQTTGSGTSLFRVRFAKGIGIIEKSIYFSDDSKVQIDSTPPIEFIQIKEILQNS